MYEVTRRAWVITLGPVGYRDPSTHVSYLSLTSDGRDALSAMRTSLTV